MSDNMATSSYRVVTSRKRESLATQLVRELTARIGRGDIKPGDKLPTEQELTTRFGVSRSVVREAISGLRADGLIATQQGVGAFVLQRRASAGFRIQQGELATVQEVIKVLELRMSIEAEAAALAATRRTNEQLAAIRAALERMSHGIAKGANATDEDFQFHLSVSNATQNKYFVDFFSFLGRMLIPRARVDLFKRDESARREYLRGVNREHEEIYLAIERQDAEAARAAMRLHLSKSRERLRAAFDTPATGAAAPALSLIR